MGLLSISFIMRLRFQLALLVSLTLEGVSLMGAEDEYIIRPVDDKVVFGVAFALMEKYLPPHKEAILYSMIAAAQDWRIPGGIDFTPLQPGRYRLRIDLGKDSLTSRVIGLYCKTSRCI